jgi:chorismate dehydratase
MDDPSALCAKLAAAELDVALVSSFEFLRNPMYRIVDGVSISSVGPVYSVIVAHRGDIADVTEIELDPASLTSVNLLHCLLAECGFKPRLVAKSEDKDLGRARLLIGDQAIRARQSETELQFWDLGEEWHRLFHLPFVFALWLIRPEVSGANAMAEKLRDLRDRNMDRLDDLIATETRFDREFCKFYYRDCLKFGFGEREREGLQTFRKICEGQGLLPKQEMALDLV